jgi:hypothetical protein
MKNMATAIVVFALAAAGALAQTGGTGIAPSQDATGANERLLEELRQITEEAERNRSASTGVIGQLRDLARRYAWPWNRLIASDEFDDRNFTQNPAWTVISGTFTPLPMASLFRATRRRQRQRHNRILLPIQMTSELRSSEPYSRV